MRIPLPSRFDTVSGQDAHAAAPIAPETMPVETFPQWSVSAIHRTLDRVSESDSPFGDFQSVLPRAVATDADLDAVQVHPIPVALSGSKLHHVTEIDATPASP